jgi:nucleoside phosphorylase
MLNVGVITALKTEIAPALKELAAKPGKLAGRTYYQAGPLTLAVSGVGAKKAEAAAVALCENFTPAAIVSTGFCGSLSPEITTGRLLIGDSLQHKCDDRLFRLARGIARDAALGHVLSVEKVMLDPHSKDEIRKRTGAVGIDMEAEAIGNVCKQYGLGFLCVKVVLDTPDAPLASNYGSVLQVLGDVLRKPSTVKGIQRDAARAKECAERLRDFFLHFGFVLNHI